MLLTAGLSFVGAGVAPPTPEWGLMLAGGRNVLGQAWWISVFPGVAISLAVFGTNLFGDALRDILDPRQRG